MEHGMPDWSAPVYVFLLVTLMLYCYMKNRGSKTTPIYFWVGLALAIIVSLHLLFGSVSSYYGY